MIDEREWENTDSGINELIIINWYFLGKLVTENIVITVNASVFIFRVIFCIIALTYKISRRIYRFVEQGLS